MPSNPAIISLEDFTESINMCIYADSGIGKTSFAGTDNVLFLSIRGENGTIAAKRQGSKAKVWKVDQWDDLQEARDWLESTPDHGFDWVCIDSVTQMQRLCMRSILDAAVAENPKRDQDIPALQDWQKYYNLFDRFIVAFNELDVNVIYTATTMRAEDEDGNTILLPELRGPNKNPTQESQKFCATLQVVGYLQKSIEKSQSQGAREEGATRKILFESLPPYFAKDRYNVLPRWLTVSEGGKQVSTLAGIRKKIQESSSEGPASKLPAKKAAPSKAVRRPVPRASGK